MAYLPMDQILSISNTFSSDVDVIPTVLAAQSGDSASFVARSSDGTLLVLDTAPGYLSISGSADSDGYLAEVLAVLNKAALNPVSGAPVQIDGPAHAFLAEAYSPGESESDKGNLSTVVWSTQGEGNPGGVYTLYVHAESSWPTF